MLPAETGLAFTEGFILILSPCILPVLPLILGAGVDGGHRRPFGIIAGFVFAFTAFALLSRKLVMALHINLDVIKYGSLILLGLFGIVLISEKLSGKFSGLTQRFATAGTTLSAGAKDGFWSGVLIGMLIGLVWTPCAGPILAAVLVQIIREENNLRAVILVASFALGAGIPMMMVAFTGRELVAKFSFLTTHAEAVRKACGVMILLAALFIASGVTIGGASVDMAEVQQNALIHPLAKPYPAPDFKGIEAWLNSKPLTMAELKGKVVLVDFWTYSCINCVRTLPYVTSWDTKYRDKGLVIIGIHSPEFEFEKNKTNVEDAVQGHGIHYPVALDNHLDTWNSFHNLYWPAHYLIDRNGNVVYTHFGEGEYATTENNIRYLLGLNEPVAATPSPDAIGKGQTPETYLGYARGARFASPEPINWAQAFSLPKTLPLNSWALSGKWHIEPQRIVAQEAGAKLQLHFKATHVFLVMGSPQNAALDVPVRLNDGAPNTVKVEQHTLYELVHQDKEKEGTVEITAPAAGLEAYAFTFGN